MGGVITQRLDILPPELLGAGWIIMVCIILAVMYKLVVD